LPLISGSIWRMLTAVPRRHSEDGATGIPAHSLPIFFHFRPNIVLIFFFNGTKRNLLAVDLRLLTFELFFFEKVIGTFADQKLDFSPFYFNFISFSIKAALKLCK
jgi:hypothetical protein